MVADHYFSSNHQKTFDLPTYEVGEVAEVASVAAEGEGGRRVMVQVGGHIHLCIGFLCVWGTVCCRIRWVLQCGEQVPLVAGVECMKTPTRQRAGVVDFRYHEMEIVNEGHLVCEERPASLPWVVAPGR